jgi:hypothetical protein
VDIGRNDPCPCGSELKYKKCCEESDKQIAPEPIRDAEGRLVGREIIETDWPAQDKRVRVIGDRVVLSKPNQTLHEFFISNLCQQFGQNWFEEQQNLPEDQRHPVERWWNLFGKLRGGELEDFEVHKAEGNLYSSEMPGEVKSLVCLAYDLFTLGDALALPASPLKRLRHKEQFQGARYELAMAAVFIRAGCKVEWITDTSRKLPEFIAKYGKIEIVVEAKSRHRRGVLGRPGETPDISALKVDVQALLDKALLKETDERPYVICIDLNLPNDKTSTVEGWVAELKEKVLREHGFETTGEREPYSAVLFTNYSWHWDGQGHVSDPINTAVRANKARVPIPLKQFGHVAEAMLQYGDVPS